MFLHFPLFYHFTNIYCSAKLRSFSVCNFLRPVISSVLDPNNILSSLLCPQSTS
jgi:hypothetical protein